MIDVTVLVEDFLEVVLPSILLHSESIELLVFVALTEGPQFL